MPLLNSWNGWGGVGWSSEARAQLRTRRDSDKIGRLQYGDDRAQASLQDIIPESDLIADGAPSGFSTFVGNSGGLTGMPGIGMLAYAGSENMPARGVPRNLPGGPGFDNADLVDMEEGSIGGGTGDQGYNRRDLSMMNQGSRMASQSNFRPVIPMGGEDVTADYTDKRPYDVLEGRRGVRTPAQAAYVPPQPRLAVPGGGVVEIGETDPLEAEHDIFGDDDYKDELEGRRSQRWQEIQQARGIRPEADPQQRSASREVLAWANEVLATAQDLHGGNIAAALSEMEQTIGSTSPDLVEAVRAEVYAQGVSVEDPSGFEVFSPVRTPATTVEDGGDQKSMDNDFRPGRPTSVPDPSSQYFQRHSSAQAGEYAEVGHFNSILAVAQKKYGNLRPTGGFPQIGSLVMAISDINLEALPNGAWKKMRAGAVGQVVNMNESRLDVEFGPTVGGVMVDPSTVVEVENMDQLSSIPELHAVFSAARQGGVAIRAIERAIEQLWGETQGQWSEIRRRLYTRYPDNKAEIDTFLASPGMEVGASREGAALAAEYDFHPSEAMMSAVLDEVLADADDGI